VTNGSGVLSWASTATGTVTSVGGTGTVSGISLSGTVTSSGNLTLGGALDLSAYNGAGAFTTLSASGNVTLSGGTANGVAYLNGSKVVTSGSALTFDGTNLGVGGSLNTASGRVALTLNATTDTVISFGRAGTSVGFILQDAGGQTFYNAENTYQRFYVNAAEQMRLTSTGLGIGTSSPAVKLDVSGAASTNGEARFLAKIADTSSVAQGNGGGLIFRGVYTGSTLVDAAGVQAYKANATDNDYSYGLAFVTRANGGNLTANMRLDQSGNLGLGVTPSAWSGGYVGLQVKDAAFASFTSGYTWVGNNWYNNSGNKYIGTGNATLYEQNAGKHSWFTAPSGTAGDAITFTQAMTLDAGGVLLVGKTSNSAYAAGGALFGVNGAADNGVSIAQSQSTGPFLTFFNSANSGFAGISQTAAGTLTTSATTALAFNTSSTQRMVIDSSGNLGLGVTPSAWFSSTKVLEIGSNGASVFSFTGGVGAVILTSNAYYSATGWRYASTGVATNYDTGEGKYRWNIAASGTAGNAITFTQAMTLDADGDLGIGVTSPSQRLHLDKAVSGGYGSIALIGNSAGAAADRSGIYGTYNGDYRGGITFWPGASGKLTFHTGNNAAPADGQVMELDPSGNLGLTKLALNIDSPFITGANISSGSNPVALGTTGSANIHFFTANSERARIDSSGNLLVGTTSTSGASGFAFISPSASSVQRLIIGHVVGNTTGDTYHEFNYNSSQIGSITQVSTTGVLYNTTSDYRLKTVTGAVTGQGARIDALKPVDYQWIEGGQQARGFLAHEFQEVYASSVNGTKDALDENGNPKYQSMQAGSSEVIADLVAEIQSLRKRLADAGI
jgi:hypothetical protein